jgi:hypothetical protein
VVVDVAVGCGVAVSVDEVLRGDRAVVGRSRAAVAGVAVASPGIGPIAWRRFAGAGGVAREDGAVQQSQDAARLPSGQPLGVIGQQPAERCRPEPGEERLDGTERHVDHGHD